MKKGILEENPIVDMECLEETPTDKSNIIHSPFTFTKTMKTKMLGKSSHGLCHIQGSADKI
uniref:Uncharacterized protein n=1 Tax=Onchocerca volvulus TaxID=6282 RepID=A0A8R1XWN1_ONCVO